MVHSVQRYSCFQPSEAFKPWWPSNELGVQTPYVHTLWTWEHSTFLTVPQNLTLSNCPAGLNGFFSVCNTALSTLMCLPWTWLVSHVINVQHLDRTLPSQNGACLCSLVNGINMEIISSRYVPKCRKVSQPSSAPRRSGWFVWSCTCITVNHNFPALLHLFFLHTHPFPIAAYPVHCAGEPVM